MAIASDEEKVAKIDIALIAPNPHQPRRQFDEVKLKELAASITEHGLIQPIVVRLLDDNMAGTYELVAGERRMRAAKLAGFKVIDAIIREHMTAEEARELVLIENLQREDLTPLEEANALAGLLEQYDGSYAHVAERLGKSETHVRLRVALLTLPRAIQDMLEEEQLNIGQAIALTQIEGETQQLEVAKKVVRLRLSPNQIKGSTQSKAHSAAGNTVITLQNLSTSLTQTFDGLESFDYQNLRDKSKRTTLERQVTMLRDKLIEILMTQFQGQ